MPRGQNDAARAARRNARIKASRADPCSAPDPCVRHTTGPGLVKRAVDMRLPHIDPKERHAMQEYLYHISVRRGSGEYALNTILSMSAWARSPLIHRLPGVRMPTVFLCKHGRTAAARARTASARDADSPGRRQRVPAPARQMARTTGWTRARDVLRRRACPRAPRCTRSRWQVITCTWRIRRGTTASSSTR